MYTVQLHQQINENKLQAEMNLFYDLLLYTDSAKFPNNLNKNIQHANKLSCTNACNIFKLILVSTINNSNFPTKF